MGLPGGAPGNEIVFDHPLAEWLGDHRPGIAEAGQSGDIAAVLIGSGRHDAVDHGRGEGDVVSDPCREIGIQLRRIFDHDARGDPAIARQVIAAEHGETRKPRIPPLPQGGDDYARRTPG
ncbi:hypothetical protein FQZ97_1103600 [compost metagenome]